MVTAVKGAVAVDFMMMMLTVMTRKSRKRVVAVVGWLLAQRLSNMLAYLRDESA